MSDLFTGTNCNSGHYSIATKIGRGYQKQQAEQKFDKQKFELKTPYQFKISNSYVTLENIDDTVNINRA